MKMERIDINLFDEELKSLNSGKEICIFESEDKNIEIFLKYKVKDLKEN